MKGGWCYFADWKLIEPLPGVGVWDAAGCLGTTPVHTTHHTHASNTHCGRIGGIQLNVGMWVKAFL